jgi:ATP-dependent DNA helicase RecG
VVGTHAIFQEAVTYRNLALVVIDEQHRFGVGQRLMLTQKGKRTPHCLAMTATPIPRTLTLAQYGEMDVSRSTRCRRAASRSTPAWSRWSGSTMSSPRSPGTSRPASRPIGSARWCARRDRGSRRRRGALRRAAARFGDQVVLVHGQLKPEVKDAAMERFARGEASCWSRPR